MKKVAFRSSRLAALCLFLSAAVLVGQQGQTSDVSFTQPLYHANAAYTQGLSPGYWPTCTNQAATALCSSLTLYVSKGTIWCQGTIRTYAGGTLTMANNATNYVYLDPTANCAPASSTSVFSALQVPIAVVVTAGGVITTITDDRSYITSLSFPNLNGVLQCSQMPALTGDVGNANCATTVKALQGNAVSTAAPTDQYFLQWIAADNKWEPKPLSVSPSQISGCLLSAGVNAQTAGYTLLSGDAGKLVTFNGSSLTATLPSSPPSSTWCVNIQNLNSSSLTVSRNGLTINGGTSNLTMAQFQVATVWTDGSNYFANAGSSAAYYQTLLNNGTALPQEPKFNFISTSSFQMGCTDNSGSTRTDCVGTTIGGGAANISSVWTGAQVASSRALNTVYQNTSGFPKIIYAFALAAGSGSGVYSLLIDSSNPPTTARFTTSSTSTSFSMELYGIVPNGQFYELTGTAGSILVWDELTVTKGNITASSDLVGSRAYSTVYQNTTGNVLWVAVQIGTGGTSTMFSDASNPPSTEVWQQTIGAGGGTNGSTFVPVLNGNYYKLTNNGTGSLTHWYEYQWDTVTAQQAVPGFTETWPHGCCTHNYFNGYGTSLWVRLSAPGTNTGTLVIQHHFSQLLSSDVVTATAFIDCGVTGNGTNVRSCAIGLNALETYAPYCDSTTCTMSDWTEYSFK